MSLWDAYNTIIKSVFRCLLTLKTCYVKTRYVETLSVCVTIKTCLEQLFLVVLSPHAAHCCLASPLARPLGGTGRGRAPPSTPVLIGTGTSAQSARTMGTAVSEQAPSLHHATDKTGRPSGDDRHGKPSSKYDPTGWAYGPTHYGMGLTTMAMTFKTNWANEGHDPEARIVVISFTTNRTTDDPGPATYSCMTPPEIRRQWRRPRRDHVT